MIGLARTCYYGSNGCAYVRRRHSFQPKPQGVRIDLADGRPHSIDVFIGCRRKNYDVEFFNKALKDVKIDEPASLLPIENRLSFKLLDVC